MALYKTLHLGPNQLLLHKGFLHTTQYHLKGSTYRASHMPFDHSSGIDTCSSVFHWTRTNVYHSLYASLMQFLVYMSLIPFLLTFVSTASSIVPGSWKTLITVVEWKLWSEKQGVSEVIEPSSKWSNKCGVVDWLGGGAVSDSPLRAILDRD